MAKGWSYTVFANAGTGFPMDMLRYDRAYPGTTDAAAELQQYLECCEAQSGFIEFRMGGARPPTDARWNSFGWQVKDVEEWGKE